MEEVFWKLHKNITTGLKIISNMEWLTVYTIETYIINLLFAVIITVNDYKSNSLVISIENILFGLLFLIMSPISVWIMLFYIIQSNLPEDFWSRPIIKLKKK